MLIAGVALSVGAVAALVRRLEKAGHRELAMRIGLAVDSNRTEVSLSRRDKRLVAAVLQRCSEGRGVRDSVRCDGQREARGSGAYGRGKPVEPRG